MARYAFETCSGEVPNEYRPDSQMSVCLSVHTCVQTDVHPPVQYICFPLQMKMNPAEAVVLMGTMCQGNCAAECKNDFVTGSENRFCNRLQL